LIRNPRLNLMDEPLGTLDADIRLNLRNLIREEQIKEGVTTLYVTHDQEEAISLADRIVVMNGGEVCQIGSPAEIYSNPLDLFVADFVGSPGMNFFCGEIRGNELLGLGKKISLERRLPESRVTVGVRPEHLKLCDNGFLGGKIIANEYLGSSNLVHIQTEFGRWKVRIGYSESIRIGSLTGINWNLKNAHFFDSRNGERLI